MEVDRDICRKHLITHHSIKSKQIMEADHFFKALCDPTRLRILVLMSREGELCVCELTHALDEIQPKISRHLAQLREITAVLDRRQGPWISYRLNPDLPDWARTVLAATTEGIMAQSPYKEDRQTLLDMPNRPGSSCCA
jgi:ArsR family transcriptional regulator